MQKGGLAGLPHPRDDNRLSAVKIRRYAVEDLTVLYHGFSLQKVELFVKRHIKMVSIASVCGLVEKSLFDGKRLAPTSTGVIGRSLASAVSHLFLPESHFSNHSSSPSPPKLVMVKKSYRKPNPRKNEGYALKLLSWAEFRSEIGKPLSGVTAVGIVSNPNVKVMVCYRGGEILETFYTVGALCGIGIYHFNLAEPVAPAAFNH